MRAGRLMAALLAVVAIAPAARAASLEHLDDGRVVIRALGERLAFREKDAARVMWYWPSEPCSSKTHLSLSLARWLEDSDVAKCLESAIPDNFVPNGRQSITFKIYLGYENGIRYPGVGKRIDRPLGDVPPLFPGDIKPEELPEPPLLSGVFSVSIRNPYTGLECLSPSTEPQDALGYERHGGGKSPPTSEYTLSADRRLNHASRRLCIGCSQISAWSCSVALRSSDNVAALSLSWFDWDFHGPRPTWVMYDAIARKIADTIFIDRNPGSVQ